jgi:hypothetical protein
MERSEIHEMTNLPGFDALQRVAQQPVREIHISASVIDPYLVDFSHKVYLDNPAYDHYLRMHKVLVGSSGADQLIRVGQELEDEPLPRFLDAAGWAYAEAGLANDQAPTTERVQLVMKAEKLWEESLALYRDFEVSEYAEWFTEDSKPFRTALNLAYAPIMKSIIVGNVTDSVRERTFSDTLAIAQLATVHKKLAETAGNRTAVGDYSGFLYECNALLTLLYLDDPRYVPMPSFARSDTGYYYRDQTHDISIVQQHWGKIRKVIPVEIKEAAKAGDRRRYKALIIGGKLHLMGAGSETASTTLDAFASVFAHKADANEQHTIDQISVTVRELLRLYQQGMQPEMVAMNSLTRFYDTNEVVAVYPELSKRPRNT